MQKSKNELTKRQHYVPKVYLKNFSNNKDLDPKVWVYDKKNNNFRGLHNITNVCIENFIYDIKRTEVEKLDIEIVDKIQLNSLIIDENQPIEKMFAHYVEGNLFKYIQNIIDRYEATLVEELAIPHNEKYSCAIYLIYQWMRTPSWKENFFEMKSVANEELLKILYAIDQDNGNQTATENLKNTIKLSNSDFGAKKIHLDILNNDEHILGMANIFSNIYKWVVIIAPDTQMFVTSDHPTSLDLYYNFDGRSLYFPISSKLCIELINKNDSRYVDVQDGQFIKVHGLKVKLINTLIYGISKQILLMEKEDKTQWIAEVLNPNNEKAFKILNEVIKKKFFNPKNENTTDSLIDMFDKKYFKT